LKTEAAGFSLLANGLEYFMTLHLQRNRVAHSLVSESQISHEEVRFLVLRALTTESSIYRDMALRIPMKINVPVENTAFIFNTEQ
jgi:hypothetical protein